METLARCTLPLDEGRALGTNADPNLVKRVKEALSVDLTVESASFLRLLMAADIFPLGGLYTGPWAHLAVRRYCCHWLALLLRLDDPRDREPLVPPLDVALVWALHRSIDIHAYVEDCTALAFRAAPEREPELLSAGPLQALNFSDGSDDAGALTRMAWPPLPADGSSAFSATSSTAGGGGGTPRPRGRRSSSSSSSRSSPPHCTAFPQYQPYWPPQLGSGTATSPPTQHHHHQPQQQQQQQQRRQSSVDRRSTTSPSWSTTSWEEEMRSRLVGLLPQAAWLLGRLMDAGFTGSPQELEAAVERYCRFLLLAQRYHFEALLFPPDVLLVWWAHKAHSSAYLADMDLLMGCPFDPVLPALDDVLLARRTAELYEFEFGEPFNLSFPIASEPFGLYEPRLSAGTTATTTTTTTTTTTATAELSRRLEPLLRCFDAPQNNPTSTSTSTTTEHHQTAGFQAGSLHNSSPRSSLRNSHDGGLKKQPKQYRKQKQYQQQRQPYPLRCSSSGAGSRQQSSRCCGGASKAATRAPASASVTSQTRGAQRNPSRGGNGGRRLLLTGRVVAALARGIRLRLRQGCFGDPGFSLELAAAAAAAAAAQPQVAVSAGRAVREAWDGLQKAPEAAAVAAEAVGNAVVRAGNGGGDATVMVVTATSDVDGPAATAAATAAAAPPPPLLPPAPGADPGPLVVPLCSEMLALFNQAMAAQGGASGCTAACTGRHRSSTGAQTSLAGAPLGAAPDDVPRAGAAVRYLVWLLERELASTAAAGGGAEPCGGGGGGGGRWGLVRLLPTGGGGRSLAALATAAAAAAAATMTWKTGRSRQAAAAAIAAAAAAATAKTLAKAAARHAVAFTTFGNLPMNSNHPFWYDCCPAAFVEEPTASSTSSLGNGIGLQPVTSARLSTVLETAAWDSAVAKAVCAATRAPRWR